MIGKGEVNTSITVKDYNFIFLRLLNSTLSLQQRDFYTNQYFIFFLSFHEFFIKINKCHILQFARVHEYALLCLLFQ